MSFNRGEKEHRTSMINFLEKNNLLDLGYVVIQEIYSLILILKMKMTV